jgi:hypothetical protein
MLCPLKRGRSVLYGRNLPRSLARSLFGFVGALHAVPAEAPAIGITWRGFET